MAALTVLEEIKRRNLLKNVLIRARELEEGLTKIAKQFPHIIEGVRGLGLLQGLVLKNHSINSKMITLKAFEKGLLIVPAGDNVIRIVPPLIISSNEIKLILKKLILTFEEF